MSVADELAKLQKLKDDGVLTAEEFDQQKAILLAVPAGRGKQKRVLTPEQAAKAKRYVALSRALGWGGLGVLFVLAPICGGTGGAIAGALVAMLGLGAAITGAVLGQIGRAIQGRVM